MFRDGAVEFTCSESRTVISQRRPFMLGLVAGVSRGRS